MTPKNWGDILRDILKGNSGSYKEQRDFLNGLLSSIIVKGDNIPFTPDFLLYAKSFSYAYQIHGPLKGIVCLRVYSDNSALNISSFIENYCRVVGQSVQCEKASALASQEVGSWGGDIAAPQLIQTTNVLTQVDHVARSYQEMSGLLGLVKRCTTGIIFTSMQDIDDIPEARSSAGNKSLDLLDIEDFCYLDIKEIAKE